ncbi:ATP-binding protein [Lewinella sp. IMCC34191]|uniref:ATP-binding protein n=1 Tax=Lewinella sp. IMCC34191 TaxID=2259172 RepID=UPI000E278CE1|nr:ATP-binding protein [Lewinella sp. IMCC34191]
MPQELYIQSYAYVLTVAPDGTVCAVSENVGEIWGKAAATAIGQPAEAFFGPATLERMREVAHRDSLKEIPLEPDEPLPWGTRQAVVHHHYDGMLLEIEPRIAVHRDFSREVALREIHHSITGTETIPALLNTLCRRIGSYLHYDRVIAYELESDGSGVVREEFNNGRFSSLYGIRYRLEDLPKEFHPRYSVENVLCSPRSLEGKYRMVGDVDGTHEIIRDCLGCREIYPTLDRFAREEEVQGLLSIALWDKDELWGMIFAHSRDERYLDHQLRNFCHLVGILVSQSLVNRASNQTHRQLLASESIRSRIRENLASASSLVEGLQRADPGLVELIPETTGAAILLDAELVTMGRTPPSDEIRRLLDWAQSQVGSRDVFATDNLASVYERGAELTATSAGVLLLPLNLRCTDWIVWFRRERAQQVTFGSIRSAEVNPETKRFASTVEIRRGYSRAWTEDALDTARDLQTYIREVIMERYSQLTRINHRLQVAYEELESFSYTVSHDLRAPLRGIDGFAEILLEDFAGRIGSEGTALIHVIQQNAVRMNQFITDILELSRIGRVPLNPINCDVPTLVRSAVQEVENQVGHEVRVDIRQPLPTIWGDYRLMAMVFRHLISNAVKYSQGQDTPEIEVGYRRANNFGDGEFYVSDNGIGIDKSHHERVFGMFNRLVTAEEYRGNGVGLAITRRILSRHNGEIRIESEPNHGAIFLFYTDENLTPTTKPFE